MLLAAFAVVRLVHHPLHIQRTIACKLAHYQSKTKHLLINISGSGLLLYLNELCNYYIIFIATVGSFFCLVTIRFIVMSRCTNFIIYT